MRLLLVGATLGAMMFGGAAVGAQTTTAPATRYSGIKLVDMKARTPEQTVTLSLEKDSLKVIDPVAKSDIKAFAYSGLNVTHTLSSAPPASAGNPASAATQRGEAPTYMGKTPRNWLTLASGADQVTLRVSQKVYDKLKASLESHGVKVEDAK
jgi:hypothetical protein